MTSADISTASAEPLELWSVTTLIKTGLGAGTGLVNWHAEQTAKYAVDEQEAWRPLAARDRDAAIRVLMGARWNSLDKAKARGTDVHRAAEQLALGVPVEIADELLPYVEQYRRWLELHEPEFLMAEAPVYSPQRGFQYAGTCDGIMRLAGRDLIFDLKTTDKPLDAKSRPPYPEVALQLAAYANAPEVGLLSEKQEDPRYGRYYVYHPELTIQPMPPVEGALAIVVSPYDCRAISVRIDAEVFRTFRHVRATALWQINTSKRVFGAELGAPRVAA